jgi:hypothetical protein
MVPAGVQSNQCAWIVGTPGVCKIDGLQGAKLAVTVVSVLGIGNVHNSVPVQRPDQPVKVPST